MKKSKLQFIGETVLVTLGFISAVALGFAVITNSEEDKKRREGANGR